MVIMGEGCGGWGYSDRTEVLVDNFIGFGCLGIAGVNPIVSMFYSVIQSKENERILDWN